MWWGYKYYPTKYALGWVQMVVLSSNDSWVLLSIIHGNENNPGKSISTEEIASLLRRNRISKSTILRIKDRLKSEGIISETKRGWDMYYSPNFGKILFMLKEKDAENVAKLVQTDFFRTTIFNPTLYPQNPKAFPLYLAWLYFIGFVNAHSEKGTPQLSIRLPAAMGNNLMGDAHQALIEYAKKLKNTPEEAEMIETCKQVATAFDIAGQKAIRDLF